MLKGLDELYYSVNKGKKVFCVIGNPIEHSLSPVMHNAVFNAMNIDAVYLSLKVESSNLKDVVEKLRYYTKGFNVTIPHKVAIIEYIDMLDDSALTVNAVNTVSNSNGILKGYNTDYHGFIMPIKRRGINLKGKSVLLLGAGGAARAVVAALAEEGIARLIIANRSIKNTESILGYTSHKGIECKAVTLDDVSRYSYHSDLIVNATPLGMLSYGKIPLTSKDISSSSIVYDLVYNPIETELIKVAKASGALIIYGYEMLVEQGAKALEIWLDMDAPRDIMIDAVLRSIGKDYTDRGYGYEG